MFKILIIFFILGFYNSAFSSLKEKVINQIQITNNLSFNFIQTIENKEENGKCIIKYPKKIYCEYNNSNKKIMVSNGKSLVIKNKNSKNHYIYPLKKTPLEFLLDKKYLISKMSNSQPIQIDNKYLKFKIIENHNEINLFFNIENLNLIGWQTEDIYQNLTIMFLSSVEINKDINDSIFILPIGN
jgi:outer membrane lipoprotein-sorting protein|tara:strand:- start:538 stop:1092 length:555 start_codon:yes stop_codon:yes gene_type:complete